MDTFVVVLTSKVVSLKPMTDCVDTGAFSTHRIGPRASLFA
jgi:hypothetical protein